MSTEEGMVVKIDWQKVKSIRNAVLPVAVQDIDSKDLLLIGYANYSALLKTLNTGKATFFSTSRGKIWVKGESSGNFLEVIEIRINCEQNSLLYLVRLIKGGACHTIDEHGFSRQSCYYRKIIVNNSGKLSLQKI